MIKLTKEDFIKKSIQKHGNKYDYYKVVYNGNKIPVTIIYNGNEYTQRPDSHMFGKCPEKEWKKNKGFDRFLIDCKRVHGNKYDYSKSIYIRDSIKLIIICDKHGEFKQTPNSHLGGYGCPSCRESSGEREIRKFLVNNDILFESQYIFEDCKNIGNLPFDFYLVDYNVCIEYDGKQHFEPNSFFGGEKSFDKLKINDNIKNKYCIDNNIKLVRIKYTDYDEIENILFDIVKKYKKITQSYKNKKFIEKAINKWGYKYDYSKVKYIDSKTPVTITYKGTQFKQTPSKHLIGKLCELSANSLSKKEFIRRSIEMWGDRFNYDDTVYINSYSKVRIFDNYNDIFIEQNANSHMNGHKYYLTCENFISISNIIYDYKYEYNVKFEKMTDYINILCKEHGEFKTRPYDHLNLRNGGICSKCTFTKFNQIVCKFLKKYNISYIKQYKFKECVNSYKLPFDFYLADFRTVIDFTYNDTDLIKINDKIKSDYCEDNYINLIRIRFDQIDNIDKILYDNLKTHITQ